MSRITTPFSGTSTAAEVAAGVDLTGRAVLVTGAASGIGTETARALAATGASVTLAVRDLADLASVATFSARWRGPLHVLVNNAAVMIPPETYTSTGWELQFATSHLGHFALAVGLHHAMRQDGDARVVSVSSSGHGASPVVFDDLFFQRRPYDPGLAYGQSKLGVEPSAATARAAEGPPPSETSARRTASR